MRVNSIFFFSHNISYPMKWKLHNFSDIWNCRLQKLSIWTMLKFFGPEVVELTFYQTTKFWTHSNWINLQTTNVAKMVISVFGRGENPEIQYFSFPHNTFSLVRRNSIIMSLLACWIISHALSIYSPIQTFLTPLRKIAFENTCKAGKRQNAGNKHFLLFPQYLLLIFVPFFEVFFSHCRHQ